MTNVREIVLNSPKHGQKICLINEEDFDLVRSYKWCLKKCQHINYAIADARIEGRNSTILMHRIILGITDSKVFTDHKDGNGLNNLRSNLRIATPLQNARNLSCRNPLGLKGIGYSPRHKKYRARIRNNGKLIGLGFFKTKIEAAKAYNQAAIKYFGEFAKLNPI